MTPHLYYMIQGDETHGPMTLTQVREAVLSGKHGSGPVDVFPVGRPDLRRPFTPWTKGAEQNPPQAARDQLFLTPPQVVIMPPPVQQAVQPASRRKRRGPKPPGREKWTWDEIDAGHRFTKSQKRWRARHKRLGATTDENGKLVAPKFEDHPEYYFVMIPVAILTVIVILFFPNGCHAH